MSSRRANHAELLRRARSLYQRGARSHHAGQYREAEAAYAASAVLFRKVFGPRGPELADAIAGLAEAKRQLDDHKGALSAANRAYAMVRGARGSAARTARLKILGVLGNIHRARGDYPRAATFLRRALALARRGGRMTRDVATAMNNLGILYKYSGQLARAEALYRESLRILHREDEIDYSGVACLYHNLGGLAYTRGSYQTAERWGRVGLELRTRLFGPSNIRVAADAAAMAASLDGLGRHSEAQMWYRKVLTIYRKQYGARHYEIAVNLNNLGASLYAQGKFVPAAVSYRQALEIKKKLLGRSHIDVALTANNLGILYLKQHRHRLALQYLGQAKQVMARKLGLRHPRTIAVLENWRIARSAKRSTKKTRYRARARFARSPPASSTGPEAVSSPWFDPALSAGTCPVPG